MASTLKAVKNIAWSEAFLLFTEGKSAKQIAQKLGTDEDTVLEKAAAGDWMALAQRTTPADEETPPSPAEQSAAARVAAFKERQFRILSLLQADAALLAMQLHRGELRIIQYFWAAKDAYAVAQERAPTVAERLVIAKYVEAIGKGLSSNLGLNVKDRVNGLGLTFPMSSEAEATLPEIVSRPREVANKSEGKVIDVASVPEPALVPLRETAPSAEKSIFPMP